MGAVAVARIQEAERLPVEPAGAPASGRGGGGARRRSPSRTSRFRYRPDLPYVHDGVGFASRLAG